MGEDMSGGAARRWLAVWPQTRTQALVAASWLAIAAVATPALAQEAEASPAQPAAAPDAADDPYVDEQGYEVEELVVTASGKPRGSVVGDIPPEITLSAREIRSYGASSVTELLEALEPQTGSSRGRGGGRPVTLLNGMRISSFSEIRDLPTEAISRVEILPEEVALKYGYPADQRVVNIVLRQRFRATTAELGATVPTQGGREGLDADVNMLTIRRENRLQLDAKASRVTPIFESERDLIARGVGRPFDLGGNVTASPFTEDAEIDPALSTLAGEPLSVVGVPAGLSGAPTLAEFEATAPGETDARPYRTLTAASQQLAVNAIYSRPIREGVGATVNGLLEYSQSQGRLGLPGVSIIVPADNPFSPFSGPVEVNRYVGDRALRRSTDTLNAHLGLSMNGGLADWRWSFTGNADRNATDSLTQRGLDITALQAAVTAGDPDVNPFAPIPTEFIVSRRSDTAHSVVTSADAQLMFNGVLKELPAGDVSTTITGGLETRHFESESLRSGVAGSADLSRHIASLRGSVDVPIASRRREVLTGLGDLSFNANLAAEELSDFGLMTTVGAGANWSPLEPLRLIASFTQEDGAPTVQQLGDPEMLTPGVRVFDFQRGETVEVSQIQGGNPGLIADNRRVLKLGLTFKPFSETNLTIRADYTRARTRDVIASFPTATSEIEAAFPERFVRDDEGRLAQIDVRPVNFARQDSEDLRWGFNYSKPLGPTRPAGGFRRQGGETAAPGAQPAPPSTPGVAPAAAGETPPAGPPPWAGRGGGGGPGGGGFGGGRGFGGGGRGAGALQFAVFHTVHLKDEILIRDGVPVLDLLNGSAAGNGGGQPRHEVDVQAGYSKNGYGARLNGRWQSGTEVRGGVLGGDDLSFSDLTTVNLRLFADLGMQPFARSRPWLRGSRATLSINNIFDSRLQVRTASGDTPVSYQPDYLDPVGRTVRLTVRKVFF